MRRISIAICLSLILCQSALANTQTPAKDITTTTGSFVNCLSSSDTNVQLSLNNIDACLGNLSAYTFADSIINISGTVTLVNDQSSPGNSQCYGTNSSGVKGWHACTSGSGTVTSIATTAPITGGTITTTGTIGITQSSTSTDGYLSSTDWNTFNNKQPSGSYLTAVTSDAPLSGAGTSGSHLVISQASTSTNGYLTSTDWNTFNSKQSALTFTNSIQNTAGSVNLVGDSTSPGNTKYYGTNGAGTKGFYSVPSTPPGGSANNIQVNDGAGNFAGIPGTGYDSNGNVGVGTINPSASLMIGASSNPLMFRADNNESTLSTLSSGSNSGGTSFGILGATPGIDWYSGQPFNLSTPSTVISLTMLFGPTSGSPPGTVNCAITTGGPPPTAVSAGPGYSVNFTPIASTNNVIPFTGSTLPAGNYTAVCQPNISQSAFVYWSVPVGNGSGTSAFDSYNNDNGVWSDDGAGYNWNYTITGFAGETATPFVITNQGNVGAGSTNPGTRLDVNGTVRTVGFTMPTGASNTYVLTSDSSGNSSWQPASGGANPGGSATQLQYQVNGTTFGGVSGTSVVSGNIGVGSANPGQVLDVTGTVRSTNFVGKGFSASQIVGTDASQNLVTLTTATYPSLMELSYVKGVTSAIQTQLNSKGSGTVTSVATDSTLTGGTITTTGTLGINLTNPNTWTGQQIFNTANVGVGSSNPGTSLDVNGTVRAVALSVRGGTSSQFLKANGTVDSTAYGTGSVTSVALSTPNSTLTLGGTNPVTTSGTISADINLTNANTWTGQQLFNTANVGINSATPGQRLDVTGTVRATALVTKGGSSSQFVKGDGSLDSTSYGTGSVTSVATDSTLTGGTITTTGTLGLNLTNANTWTGQQLFNTANVGINSATPGQRLDVGGTVRATALVTRGGTSSQFVKGDGSLDSTSYGTGTVTAVSVASANGFTGSSSGGATPALTLTTSITGPLKGNGTAVSAAVASDIVGLFSTCSGTQYLGADGNCHTASGSSQWTTTNTNDVYLPSNGNVGLGTNLTSTAALTVMNGNVGIGTWIPGATLDVKGTLQTTFGSNVSIGTTANTNALDVNGNVNIGAAYAGIQTNLGNALAVQGNVGIGTWQSNSNWLSVWAGGVAGD